MSAVLSRVETPNWRILAPKEIPEIWPYVRAGVAQALSTSNGEATVEDTLKGLMNGATQLAIFSENDAFLGVVFMLLNFPRYKIARVLLLFGAAMNEMTDAMSAAEQWAKTQGCRYVEAWVATASRERLFSRFGYHPTYRILRKPL